MRRWDTFGIGNPPHVTEVSSCVARRYNTYRVFTTILSCTVDMAAAEQGFSSILKTK